MKMYLSHRDTVHVALCLRYKSVDRLDMLAHFLWKLHMIIDDMLNAGYAVVCMSMSAVSMPVMMFLMAVLMIMFSSILCFAAMIRLCTAMMFCMDMEL